MQKKPSMEPKLARPGAGIPLFEALLMRFWILPRAQKRMSAEAVSKVFLGELRKIYDLASILGEKQLATRVLVPRVPGLEDSSRYWSVAMALEHVVLVSESIEKISASLARGIVPPIRVDIAKIKPRGQLKATEVLAQFRSYLQLEQEKGPLEHLHVPSKATLPHPWFGNLHARAWNTLKASHAAVHRKQIQLIVKSLQA